MEGFNRRLQHFRRAHVFPCDVIAVLLRHMADEFTLCPSVSFTEGMQGVQLPKIMPGTFAELFWPKSGQMFFLCELGKDRLCATLDVAVMSKQVSPFAYVRGAQFPGPLVHITEQMPVDRL